MLSSSEGRVRFALSSETSAALIATSRENGVTPFMLLLAAFCVLLYRYSGQSDFAVGTPIAGRNRTEIEELIGFFVNTLIMRADLSGEPSFIDVLSRVRDTALGAYEHGELPFEKLVEELTPDRDTSRNPIFQVMFAFQNVPKNPLQLAGLDVSPYQLDLQNSKFDLSLTINPVEGGFAGDFSYSSDLIVRETIERMSSHYTKLLQAVLAHPDKPIHELSMFDEGELRQILIEWNETHCAYDTDQCIHYLIEQQAVRTPARAAVVFEDTRLTYKELNARANQLAHYLMELGVVPDMLVGLSVLPSLEMLVAIVGILKAGGAYVPIDPTYPEARQAFMLDDSEVQIVITNAEISLPHADRSISIINLEREWADISKRRSGNPVHTAGAEHLVYMIYTSGSTGNPKGVLIEHRSVSNLAFGLRDRIYRGVADLPLRKTLSTSISFDASVDDWIMLAFGHEIHVIPQDLRTDINALMCYLEEQRIDVFDCVPSQLALMLEEGLLDSSRAPQIIMVGGEAIDPHMWKRLSNLDKTRTYNMYGPTECTVEVEVAEIGVNSGVPVIGRPLGNCRVFLLDSYGDPVPQGAVGEIYIGGDGLARGYHRRPELADEKFKWLALPGQATQRLYKTGDFGRYLPNGTLCFLGRADNLVKLSGFTIELGEVEAVIASMPGVITCVAVTRKDLTADPLLVVYFCCEEPGTISADRVKSYTQSQLPSYMVPSAFIAVDRLPLTPNGKIDRASLSVPDMESLGLQSSYAAPTTALQNQLAEIWSTFMLIDQIGIDDDFFDLGGHSLLATRVVNRINQCCGTALELRTLFDEPTIRRLTGALEALNKHLIGDDGLDEVIFEKIPVIPRVARRRPNRSN